MKVLPRTITIEQDRKLREIAKKTGRKISELTREAVDTYIFLKNGLTPSRL
ncbi:MAG: ribbon-helix-helix domain-containing protein [Candidatus Omnitrophota bacterium]|nr:ribbon-helix-helix domain-containing protein [Candidatus Omnitrophota bacterium]